MYSEVDMNEIAIGKKSIYASQIGLGCRYISKLQEEKKVRSLIEIALESGINLFDHADIYGQGMSEIVFGNCISHELREKMILQSKCGIRKGVGYDFSKEYILKSVDGILKRLQTEFLDILLLHRPDTLMDEEVALAIEELEKSGKVHYFGVSNQNAMQLALMNKYCNNKIIINQLQLSIAHCSMIDAGLNVNMENEEAINRDGSILEYCRLHDITIQSWSPLQSKAGTFIENEKFQELNFVLQRIAEKYEVTKNAIAIAWISRHPANIQTIIGSTNKERVKEICAGAGIKITRKEWYELYMASGKKLP